LYTFLISPMLATCPAHLILDLVTVGLLIFSEQNKLWRYSFRNFLQRPVQLYLQITPKQTRYQHKFRQWQFLYTKHNGRHDSSVGTGFDSWRAFRPALRPTESPVRCVPGLPQREQSGRSVRLTIDLHPTAR
jgi:hypothetical protein